MAINIKPPNLIVSIEGSVFCPAPVQTADVQEDDIRFALPMPYIVPMFADRSELEPNDRWSLRLVDFDVQLCGLEGPPAETMFFLCVTVDHYSAARIIPHEIFVGEDTSIFAELMRAISREMPHAEVNVGRGELLRAEGSLVAFVLQLAAKVTGTPAGIDQLPFTIINPTSVPGVSRFERGYWIVGPDWAVSKAFASS